MIAYIKSQVSKISPISWTCPVAIMISEVQPRTNISIIMFVFAVPQISTVSTSLGVVPPS
jgi:hypothetical protein